MLLLLLLSAWYNIWRAVIAVAAAAAATAAAADAAAAAAARTQDSGTHAWIPGHTNYLVQLHLTEQRPIKWLRIL